MVAGMFGLTLAVNPVAAPNAHAAASVSVRARAVHAAAAQAGIRYLYGGTTRRGFDCSGLTQYAYARAGKHIPRTAQQQYKASIHVSRHNARYGDLVFFYSGKNVYHVGILAEHGTIWHAPHTGAKVSKVKLWTKHVLFGRVR
jgi:cell wall-associated NlpC family hydrolase